MLARHSLYYKVSINRAETRACACTCAYGCGCPCGLQLLVRVRCACGCAFGCAGKCARGCACECLCACVSACGCVCTCGCGCACMCVRVLDCINTHLDSNVIFPEKQNNPKMTNIWGSLKSLNENNLLKFFYENKTLVFCESKKPSTTTSTTPSNRYSREEIYGIHENNIVEGEFMQKTKTKRKRRLEQDGWRKSRRMWG